MSLINNIKEFADVLTTIYSNQLTSIDPTQVAPSPELSQSVVLQQAFIHLVKSLGSVLFYFVSFQWLRDFSYLPLLAPSILNSSVFLDTFGEGSHLFSLGLQPESNGLLHEITNQLVAGCSNSFFLSLPFSLPQLVTLRRLFSQGRAAAGASIVGTVAAHSLFLVGVLYGLRFLLIPYLSFHPLTFVIGLITVVSIINELVKKKMYLVPLKQRSSLVRILVLNFFLALCEETTIFHSFKHLTLNTGNSFLEFSSANNSFFLSTVYLFAFVVGHCAFCFAFCFFFLQATQELCSLTGWTLSRVARRINQFLLVFIVAFTFSSFPYYGLDYLFTKIGGFLPEDPFLSNTVFSPTMVKSRNTYFKSNAPAKNDEVTPLELDLNYFDRGVYLNASKEENKLSSGLHFESPSGAQSNQVLEPTLTFEELNYQGEYAWLMRHERARAIDEEQSSLSDTEQGRLNSFSSFFQQPKTHFKELRLKQENNQTAAALKERSPRGYISKWKEGTLPGESTPFEALTLVHNKTKNAKGDYSSNAQIDQSQQKQSLLDKPQDLSFLSKNTNIPTGLTKDLLDKELTFEEEVATNYTKGFVSPFSEEAESTTPLELIPIENIIKKRYLLNPVYRTLLETDIDTFLARQPAQYKIAENQEHSLFKKRQLLERYYDWLRYYAPLDTILNTKANTCLPFAFTNKELTLPKSFVDTVYHQQFKGTLNTAKRLFKVTFDSQQNPTKNRVLAYDLALYKDNPGIDQQGFTPTKGFNSDKKGKKELIQDPSLHEELVDENISPFIEESISLPLYAGWDDQARKFVITNRFNT